MPYFLLLFQVAKHKHYFLPSRLLLRVRSLVKPQKAGRKTHHLVIQPDCVLTVVNIVAGVDRLGVKIIGGFTAGLGLVTHSEGTEACWEVFLSVCPFCPSALLFELHFNGSILHHPPSTRPLVFHLVGFTETYSSALTSNLISLCEVLARKRNSATLTLRWSSYKCDLLPLFSTNSTFSVFPFPFHPLSLSAQYFSPISEEVFVL